MAKVWPLDTIRELFAIAHLLGKSRATLASEREAELFRYSVYNFRRRNPLGTQDVLVTIEPSATANGSFDVILTRRQRPNVVVIQQEDRV